MERQRSSDVVLFGTRLDLRVHAAEDLFISGRTIRELHPTIITGRTVARRSSRCGTLTVPERGSEPWGTTKPSSLGGFAKLIFAERCGMQAGFTQRC